MRRSGSLTLTAMLVLGAAPLAGGPLATAAHAATCPSFTPLAAVASDAAATALATGEFNDIPPRDVVATNIGVNAVSTLIGSGGGHLFLSNTNPAGNPPGSLQQNNVAVGDFDEDGIEDLAVVKLGEATMTIMVGRPWAHYEFGAHASFGTGAYPFGVAVADFDRDGHDDVATANFNSGTSTLTVLYGDGTGSMVETKQLDIGSYATALDVADLDNDGKPEIVATSSSGVVIAANWSSPRNWNLRTQSLPGVHVRAITATNVDHDLFADVVVGSDDGAIRVLRGTGVPATSSSGWFAIGSPIATGTALAVDLKGLAAADLDGDGNVDLAALPDNGGLLLPQGEPSVRVLRGDGQGGFSAADPVTLGRYPTDIDLADMNDDGANDLVVSDDDGVYVAVNTCVPAMPLDIVADSVEVVQTVQDESNSISLIAGKRTVVRGHVHSNRAVDDVQARLWRVDANGNPVGAPLAPASRFGRIDVTTSPQRARMDDAFTFELPPEWAAGSLGLRLDVNPSGTPTEANTANNSKTATVSFLSPRTAKITLVDYRWTTCPGSAVVAGSCRIGAPVAGYTAATTTAQMDAIERELRRQLPVSDLHVERRAVNDDCPSTAYDSASAKYVCVPLPDLDWSVGTHELNRAHRLHQQLQSAQPNSEFVWLSPRFSGGVAEVPSPYEEYKNVLRWDTISAANSPATAMQEVGHALGVLHTGCTDKFPDPGYQGGRVGGPGNSDTFVGFRMADAGALPANPNEIVPPSTPDTMSYCAGSPWPSGYSYSKWNTGIAAWPELTDPTGDFALVSGTVAADGTSARFDAVQRLSQVTALSPPPSGSFVLRLVGATGTTLAQRAFEPTASTDHEGDAATGFVQTFDWVVGTRRVDLVSPGGQVLASHAVSASAPQVTNVAQDGGSLLAPPNDVTVSWTGSDADGDALRASVQYSRDGGATWSALATGLAGASFTIPVADLAGTDPSLGRFRVMLSDGALTTVADTAPFTVRGHAPEISIASPFPNARYELGQTSALEAVAQDREDGPLDGAHVEWTSSVDGALGTGRLLSARLSEGTHILTAVATDGDGETASATVVVTVVHGLQPGLPPVVDAGTAVSTSEGSTLVLSGSATDPDDDPLLIGWSVVDAPTADFAIESAGTLTPSVVLPEQGTYVLRLTASDGLNEAVSDDVTITVANVAPTVQITKPSAGQLFPVGTVALTATYTDPGILDDHTCAVNWDVDQAGYSQTGVVDAGAHTCSSSRTLGAGVYTIRASVTDDDGATGAATVQVIVYDPTAGFVTGGGWITSPPGALMADPTATGKATFGFVSRYQRSSTTPTGETEFAFLVGGVQFRSTSYEWLVVSGRRAQYKGVGTLNGASGYGFMLTTDDGNLTGGDGLDRFRMKIWNRSTGLVVYDSGLVGSDDINSSPLTVLGGGSIVIHRA